MLIINSTDIITFSSKCTKYSRVPPKCGFFLRVNYQRREFIGVLWYKICYTVDSFN